MRRPAATVALLAWYTVAAWSQEPVLRMIDMKAPSAKPIVEHRKAYDRKWYPAFVGTEGSISDHFKTNAETVAALEFYIGGRVGVARNTDLEIVTERSVTSTGPAAQRVILHSGTLWMKSDGKLSRPLEIQTNGGTMGIKGTEFTLESTPDSGTKLAVLQGAVEVRDESNKFLAVAVAGDIYSSTNGTNPELQHVGLAAVEAYTKSLRDASALEQLRLSIEPPKLSANSERDAAAADLEVNKADLEVVKGGHEVGQKGLEALQEKLNALRGKGEDQDHYHLAAPYNDAIRAGVGPSGGSRLAPTTPAPSPSETLFTWKEYPGADGYVLFVSDTAAFSNILYSDRVRDTRAVYPAIARPLTPGRYYWRIIPVQSDDSVVTGAQAGQAQFDVTASR